MALITGQTIPAESDSAYHFACHRAAAWKGIQYVRRRMPLRLPNMQGLTGKGIKPAQAEQRSKFRDVVSTYHKLTPEARARWKEESPEWKSTLFWYNYFMLEGLWGGGVGPGYEMIKGIQHGTASIPQNGTATATITTIVPTKAVVLLHGAAYSFDHDMQDIYPYAWAWVVDPIIHEITATTIVFKWSLATSVGSIISFSIVEYI